MNDSATLLDRWKLVKLASVDPRLSRGDVAVLIAILDRLNDSGVAWPSLARIADDAGISRTTAVRSVRKLSDLDYLRRESGTRIKANRYRPGRCAAVPRCVDEPRRTGEPRVGARVNLQVGAPVNPELASLNLPTEPSHIAATAADAARPADPIWGVGLQFLIRKGVKPQAARAFLGKFKAMVGDTAAAILLGTAQAQDITDPRAWLMKAAQGGAGKGRPVGAITRDDRDDHDIEAANRAELARFGVEVTHDC